MSDVIKAGIYSGENKVKQVSIDRRTIKVKDGDGDYVDVPSLDYVRNLENQILELRHALAISERAEARQEMRIKKLEAAMKKVGSKLS